MRNICRRATGIVVADGPALDAFVEIFRDLPPEAAVCPISTVALLTASTACKAGTISPLAKADSEFIVGGFREIF